MDWRVVGVEPTTSSAQQQLFGLLFTYQKGQQL
jgi:hypothetical protein